MKCRALFVLFALTLSAGACGDDESGDATDPGAAEAEVASDDASPPPTSEEPATATEAPVATPTSEPTPTPEPEPAPLSGRYVSIGSSYAAGQGSGPDVTDGPCVQGAENYPRLVADALALELVDMSCNGATIDNVVDTPQGTSPPQIEAVTPDTALVTITVGGNDVDYVANFFACIAGCPEAIVGDEAARTELFAGLTGDLVEMLDMIRERAPDARILLIAYPLVVDGPDVSCEGILDADIAFQFDMGARLQQAFVDASAAADAEFVDLYSASSGFGACSPPATSWVDGATTTTSALPWHPNAAGNRATAELIVAHLTNG